MINLILSLIIGAAAWVASSFIFGSIPAGILPFFIFTIAALVVLNRRTAKKVQAITMRMTQMMQSLPTLPSENARKNLMDKAVEVAKEGYAYKNYQFFLAQQLNAQIGQIYYIQKRFKDAEPYLKDSFMRPGTPRAMYACLMFRQKNKDAMVAEFEKAVKFDAKTPLLWNVYAWCLNELKERDVAIKVLNRCLAANPGDKTTQDNLDLIKNSGKVKMRGYNEQWYQFWLEEPPQQKIMVSPFSKRAMFHH